MAKTGSMWGVLGADWEMLTEMPFKMLFFTQHHAAKARALAARYADEPNVSYLLELFEGVEARRPRTCSLCGIIVASYSKIAVLLPRNIPVFGCGLCASCSEHNPEPLMAKRFDFFPVGTDEADGRAWWRQLLNQG